MSINYEIVLMSNLPPCGNDRRGLWIERVLRSSLNEEEAKSYREEVQKKYPAADGYFIDMRKMKNPSVDLPKSNYVERDYKTHYWHSPDKTHEQTMALIKERTEYYKNNIDEWRDIQDYYPPLVGGVNLSHARAIAWDLCSHKIVEMTKDLREIGGELILDMVSELTTLRNTAMMRQIRIDKLEEQMSKAEYTYEIIRVNDDNTIDFLESYDTFDEAVEYQKTNRSSENRIHIHVIPKESK